MHQRSRKGKMKNNNNNNNKKKQKNKKNKKNKENKKIQQKLKFLELCTLSFFLGVAGGVAH